MNDDSISEIEQYIDERKSDLPHCMRDATDEKASRSFKFPPGHKIRIRKFIMKHKDLFSPQKPMKSEIVIRNLQTEEMLLHSQNLKNKNYHVRTYQLLQKTSEGKLLSGQNDTKMGRLVEQ